MRKWLWALLLLMFSASSAWATDVTPTIRPAALLTSQTAIAPGPAVAISGFNVVAFQLTGISGDTIQFEVSQDNSTWIVFACFPANGTSAVTTATANGGYQCATGGYAWFRLNKTAGASGVTATGIMSTLGAGLGKGGSGGGGTSHALLSTTHTDSTAATGVSGDILRFNTTWERLAKGADGSCLTLVAGLPGWGACSGSTAFSAITPGTNTGALVIGSGGSLTTTGTGTITANGLKANGGNCAAGSAPEGVDAAGAVENCTAYQANNTGLGQIGALADPNADRMLFWDDSANAYTYLTPGTGLSITGTTLNATGTATIGFDGVQSGTSTGQSLVVGNGSTVSATGTGTIAATTALGLATNGGNCPLGQGAGGIATNGSAEDCTNYVEEPISTGVLAKTAANTTAARTIAGTAGEIAVTNGDGVTGDPTIALPATINLTSKTLTIPNSTTLPATCSVGNEYMDTDATPGQNSYLCTAPNTWTLQGGAGGGGAPTTATYITQTPDATLSNEQALSALASGCLSVTTTTGVLASTGAPCGAGGGSVSSVDASGGAETTTGSAITSTGTIRTARLVNAQTGTTYTLVTGDRGKLITHSNAATTTDTLPQAGGTFPAGWYVFVQNVGAGTVTIAPVTSTIDGLPVLNLVTGQGVLIASDGTNYSTMRGAGIVAEADTLRSVVNRDLTAGVGPYAYGLNSYANSLKLLEANNFVSGTSGVGFTFYVDPTDGPYFACIVAGLANNCDYYRKLNAGKKLGVKNSSGTVIWEVDEATGAVTAASINAETTGVTITAPFKHNFKMVGCAGTTGTLLLDTNATLAPTATCTPGSTNATLIIGTADFPDSAGQFQVQDSFRLPGDFTGNIDLQFYWRTTATSGDVIWYAATMCTSDAEVEDVAWNTASSVTDTAKGTTLQFNTASISAVTATNCAAGDYLHLKLYRDNSGSDTLAATAQLRNVELTLRRGM